MSLSGKNIVVGLGGGIAAYKAVELVRELGRRGATVKTVMTRSAKRFVGPTTLTGLTGEPPVIDLWDARYPGEVHVALTDWADALVVAPATHNLMARFCTGLADDALLATLSCAAGPIVMAPAMHTRMWESKANQRNVKQLQADGVILAGPVSGVLANGATGMGRMAEPVAIADVVERRAFPARDMVGKTVLISAGPTQEALDPVRYISNRSTGRMGFAIAEAARDRGARVLLVCGPTTITPPPGVEVTAVESAEDMRGAIHQLLPQADAVVMTAAVADYRPKAVAEHKIKKRDDDMSIELVKNPDILAELGQQRRGKRPVLVGFAMETQDVAAYARRKLEQKRVDMVVGNEAAVGFGTTDNQVTLVTAAGDEVLPLMPKRAVADELWTRVLKLFA